MAIEERALSHQHDLRAYRIRRLLRDYDALRSPVRRNVRGWLGGRHLPEPEFEAIYNFAWQSLVARLERGEAIHEPAAWLTRAAYFGVSGYFRSARVSREVPSDETALLQRAPDDVVEQVEHREQIWPVLEAIRSNLSQMEASVLYLRIIEGCPCTEIAARLGSSRKRIDNLLYGQSGREGLTQRFARLVALIAKGRWCDEQASLLTAHALGWFPPGSPKDLQACAHLRRCPNCRDAHGQQRRAA
jgi:DNA-directed RNA polymerase specialized sigma24 family protein